MADPYEFTAERLTALLVGLGASGDAVAATLTAGGTAAMWLGKGIESATAGLGVFDGHYDFDGKIIVPPGQLVFVCGSVAQTGLFSMSLTWAEVCIA